MSVEFHRLVVALEALRRHRLRTALSVLGVVLAVAVTQTTLAVNEGARREALRQVEALGADTILVVARMRDGAGPSPLSSGDAGRLARMIPRLAAVAPVIESEAVLSGNAASERLTVVGVTATFVPPANLRAGRFLSRPDDDSAARVCVLGSALARRLIGRRDPIGESLSLNGDSYRVVGLFDGRVRDAEVVVPLAALAGRHAAADPRLRVDAIWMRAATADGVSDAARAVRSLLARVHPAGDYDVVVPRELLNARDRAQRMFTLVAMVTGALLFLLGGAAITNAMLASVLERTPEIGLRRAVGATKRDVILQFLVEASMISGCGGVAGVLGGLALSTLTSAWSGWPVPVSVTTILKVMTTALTLGVASGLYPALRAAQIQPIEALTHE